MSVKHIQNSVNDVIAYLKENPPGRQEHQFTNHCGYLSAITLHIWTIKGYI